MGLFGPSAAEKAQLQLEAEEIKRLADTVKVTTGDIKDNYEIVRVVFELGVDEGGLMGAFFGTGGSPEAAFENAEMQLKGKAAKLGCDYVINTVFNQRIAVGKAALGNAVNQVIEVFAYGTAVKTK